MARTLDGKYLIADLNDSEGAFVSASLPESTKLTQFNENQTEYLLFPYELNDPPVITANVFESSEPVIKSILDYKEGESSMYYDEGGVVKVVTGVSFMLKVSVRQPNVLNVENGIPTIIPQQQNLFYEWFKDGDRIIIQNEAETLTPINQGTLSFSNVTIAEAGAYICRISNDIGSVDTEPIQIEVLEQYITNDPLFSRNLVLNPFAVNNVDDWTTSIGGIVSKRLANKEDESELKQPYTNLFKHTLGAFYPRPETLHTPSARDYNIPEIIKDKGMNYFSRDVINYVMNGGTNKVVAYQDIDLTDYTDYISGKAYGCSGVKAFFGCFIGNAISRFIPVIDILGPDERNKPENYYSNAPRISYENFALAGPGLLEESVTVIVQEFSDEEPLMSSISYPLPDGTYETPRMVSRVEFTDTLSNLLKTITDEESTIQPPITSATTADGITVTYPPMVNKVLGVYNKVYPNKLEYYTQGQYVDYNHAIFDRLNYNTNKIRITLQFDIDNIALADSNPRTTQVNKLLELAPYDRPYIKGLVPLQRFRKDVVTVFNENQNSKYKDQPLEVQVRPNEVSKAMVTGIGLLLHPITSKASGFIGTTNATYANSIMQITPKQSQLRSIPLNVLTSRYSFAEVIQRLEGLGAILDLVGDVNVRFYRRYTMLDWHDFDDDKKYNRDDEEINGRITIRDVTTDTNITGTSESHGEGGPAGNSPIIINPPGLHTIRITVNNDDNEFGETYPYLTLQLTNLDEQYGGEIGGATTLHIFPTEGRLSFSPRSITSFTNDSSYRAGMNPNNTEYVREFSVDVPSNLLLGVFGGVRNSGPYTRPPSNNTIRAKIDYGPNGVVYYRTA